MEWQALLDGILMSDGNLTLPGQCHFPRYQQTCKEPTFLQWVGSWLPVASRISGPHQAAKYHYWLLSTRTSPIFADFYQHWYPQGKKRLPSDLQISPELLLTEYLGDGHLMVTKDKKVQHIEFGTYGFDRSDLAIFVGKLECLGFRLKQNKTLYLKGSRVKHFLDYIGPCPVPSLAYKWKSIPVKEYAWRLIVGVEEVATVRAGAAVKVMLACGHSVRRPASRLRSERTNMMICRLCDTQLCSSAKDKWLTEGDGTSG